MGNANIGESEKRDILIARTNSPVSVISDRSQGVLLKNPESSEKLSTLIRSVSSFEEVKHEEGISHAVVNRNGPTLPPISSFDKISANDGINDIREVIEPEIKEESAVKAPKPSAKNTKSNARTTGKATKATSRTKKEAVKKEPKSETNGKTEKTGRSKTTKTKADPKSKADPKGKSESKGKCEPKTKSDEECKEPKESICNTNNNSNSMAADGAAATSDSSLNTDTATNIIGGKSRQDASDKDKDSEKDKDKDQDSNENKLDPKKDKNKKKKIDTPRKLVPAPIIKSPKLVPSEANGKPIVILDIPLYDVADNDYLDENGQVVFNVYNMIQEQYGSQLNKAKRNLMVDLNEDVEAAEDNEGEEGVEVDQEGDDDDDEDDEDEDDEDEEGTPADSVKNKDTSVSPKKKRPNPMKGKSRIGKYDIEDPFIDDSELLWEEQRAATKDGFFVYFGPLIEKGQYASFQRVDGTMKKGGIKNPK